MSLFYQNALYEVPFTIYFYKWLEYALVTVVLIVTLRTLYLYNLKKYPGPENRKKRWLFLPLLLIPFSIILCMYLFFIEPHVTTEIPGYVQPNTRTLVITGSIMLLVNEAAYTILIYIYELNQVKVKAEQLEKEKAIAQLINLQNQMNPHFLFNSLNTLVFLIENDKDKSIDFVHKLAFFYKRMVSQHHKNLISLKEELEYIEAYTKLLKIRHGGNLNFNFTIREDVLTNYVVPMSIQIGIENAVKHNNVSQRHPLTITIYSQNQEIVIENNLQKTEKNIGVSGLGISNINKRYQLVANKTVSTEDNGSVYRLKIPLIHKDDKKMD
ncbi:hypothetical protein BUL40_12110 [Croceivirga radicis]|uniref:Signal transduction histidine kinase internal region domain-containing protein n=1 Tax=Croceivirga radicis TaxID=1929488 RepID=A0A1V6LQ49_9FLAO|nr:histidine kinase [Croceivirga radicis]OQD42157.1 hypothetical protein BUL40_12110 [Croceivirga radicis]